MGLLDVLNQVMSAGAGAGGVSGNQFDQVAQHASHGDLSDALSHMFQSDQTPDLGSMVGQMFGGSNSQQQAGALNQIIAALGPAMAGSLAGGVLGNMLRGGQTELTPEQAQQLSPQQMQQVVTEAHQQNPGIGDQLAQFYAQHSGLIKTLGGAALAVALARMKNQASKA